MKRILYAVLAGGVICGVPSLAVAQSGSNVKNEKVNQDTATTKSQGTPSTGTSGKTRSSSSNLDPPKSITKEPLKK